MVNLRGLTDQNARCREERRERTKKYETNVSLASDREKKRKKEKKKKGTELTINMQVYKYFDPERKKKNCQRTETNVHVGLVLFPRGYLCQTQNKCRARAVLN